MRSAGAEARASARPTVLIGKDTRISGYMIESALEAGFASAGVDVLLTGPLPTPGVAYLTRALRLSLGVVISASHNPFARQRHQVLLGARREAARRLGARRSRRRWSSRPRWVDSAELGKARRARRRAAAATSSSARAPSATTCRCKGLKIVVDAAHGAAYHVAPDVFHELGAEVIGDRLQPDGININAGFGATAPAALVDAVSAQRRRLRHRARRRRRPAADGRCRRPPLQRRRAALRDGRRPAGRRARRCPAWSAR